MDPTTTPSTWPRPVHLARVGIEPEPSSGEARFVGEPTRGEQRHGQMSSSRYRQPAAAGLSGDDRALTAGSSESLRVRAKITS